MFSIRLVSSWTYKCRAVPLFLNITFLVGAKKTRETRMWRMKPTRHQHTNIIGMKTRGDLLSRSTIFPYIYSIYHTTHRMWISNELPHTWIAYFVFLSAKRSGCLYIFCESWNEAMQLDDSGRSLCFYNFYFLFYSQ